MIFPFKLHLFGWTGSYWSPQGIWTIESRRDSGYRKPSGVFLQPPHHQHEAMTGACQQERTGQVHLCCQGGDMRAWEERSKRVWKEKRNCFLKAFIYKLPPGQTRSYFLFLELGWDPSLYLSLGEPKGKTLVMRSRARGLEKVQLESFPQLCSAVWGHKG